ncbi:MAG: hypothetical protein ACHREM_06020 [Polyangiales bacterium]
MSSSILLRSRASAFALVLATGCVSRTASEGATPFGDASVSVATDRSSTTLVEHQGVWTGADSAQRFTTRVDGAGATVEAIGSRWRLNLHLARVGRAGAMRDVGSGAPHTGHARAEIDRTGAVREWYSQDARGLEQGVDLATRPDGVGDLQVEVAVEGLTPIAFGDRVELRDERGRAVLGYEQLAVRDADGHDVAASLELAGGAILLRIHDASARYPLAIDPLLLSKQQAELIATDGAAGDELGAAVAMDGPLAIVGAASRSYPGFPNYGGAYVFAQSGTTWSQQGAALEPKEYSSSTGKAFGNSVAISGTLALVGGDAYYPHGAAYLFAQSGTAWTEKQIVLDASPYSLDHFGTSVALSGTTAVIGAPAKSGPVMSNAGAAIVFGPNGTTWSEQTELAPSDPADYDTFGSAVALDGSTILVGANGKGIGGMFAAGAAYVFSGSGATWTQQGPRLVASDGAAYDAFGSSAAISGTTAIVGAPAKTVGGNGSQGEAYVFALSGGTWTQQGAPLVAPDGVTNQQFGASVAISGAVAIVGAPFNGPGPTGAYVFVKGGTGWVPQGPALHGVAGATTDAFGFGVAMSGTSAIVGSRLATGAAGSDQGAAYVFVSVHTNGDACASAYDCLSNNCVEGVCCDTACAGTCQSCVASRKASGATGTCGFVANGGAHSACTGTTCTGAGSVARVGSGAGACGNPQPVASCGLYSCNPAATACDTKCAVDGDCIATAYCASGACVAKVALGATCTAVDQCLSSFCADGVCCSTACTGTCAACVRSATGASDGTCTNVLLGLDPRKVCPGGSVCAAGSTTTHACNGVGSCNSSTSSCGAFGCNAAGTGCSTTCKSDSDCGATDYCSSGVCTARGIAGASCAANDQCTTGYCTDGVCCSTACTGLCQACSAAKRGTTIPDGTCGPIAAGIDPDKECPGQSCSGTTQENGHACNGASACQPTTTTSCLPYSCGASACKSSCAGDGDCGTGDWCSAKLCVPKGASGSSVACTANDQCVSGFCVDGYCCNTECTGTCLACAAATSGVAGTNGTCTPIKDGADPNGECAALGATCSGSTLFSQTCNGAGACRAQSSSCAPSVCNSKGTACVGHCSTDSDCVPGSYCSSGSCVSKEAAGAACGGNHECALGFCTDGVCCTTACTGTCQACSQLKKGSGGDGICGFISDGTDPDVECPGQTCTGSTQANGHVCDGSGACRATTTTACAPFACSAIGTACGVACAASSDCDATGWCSSGACVSKQANGTTCSVAAQCATGNCVDGVCCNVACVGKCEACVASKSGVPGTDGVCTATVAGTDPDGDCGAASCTGTTLTTNACDGKGACSPTTKACTPFACNAAGTGCATTCTSDTDCGTTGYCDSGTCAPKVARGNPCTASNQCVAGSSCADGVCCNEPCTGQCQACAEPGTVGTCVAAKGRPRTPRAPCNGTDPACLGACDGVNIAACSYASAGQTCGTGCSGGDISVCDATGTCLPPTPCPGNLVCESTTNKCNTACVTDSDCAASFVCTAGKCQTKPPASCSADGLSSVPANDAGPAQSCAPYVCDSTGACKSGCNHSSDCIAGATCDTTTSPGQCVVPPTTSSGGCAVSFKTHEGDGRLCFVLLSSLALVGRLRRRQSAARSGVSPTAPLRSRP